MKEIFLITIKKIKNIIMNHNIMIDSPLYIFYNYGNLMEEIMNSDKLISKKKQELEKIFLCFNQSILNLEMDINKKEKDELNENITTNMINFNSELINDTLNKYNETFLNNSIENDTIPTEYIIFLILAINLEIFKEFNINFYNLVQIISFIMNNNNIIINPNTIQKKIDDLNNQICTKNNNQLGFIGKEIKIFPIII